MFRLRLQIPIKLRITITWTACRRAFQSPGRRRFMRIYPSTESKRRLTRSVWRIDPCTSILPFQHDHRPFFFFSSFVVLIHIALGHVLVTVRCKFRYEIEKFKMDKRCEILVIFRLVVKHSVKYRRWYHIPPSCMIELTLD